MLRVIACLASSSAQRATASWPVSVFVKQHTVLAVQDEEFVRPGFELGYEENGKYYVKNHLQFNILVHPTHGEYMRARQGYKDAAVLENIDARRLMLRRQLLDAGVPAEQLAAAGSAARSLQEDAAAGEFRPCTAGAAACACIKQWRAPNATFMPCALLHASA